MTQKLERQEQGTVRDIVPVREEWTGKYEENLGLVPWRQSRGVLGRNPETSLLELKGDPTVERV